MAAAASNNNDQQIIFANACHEIEHDGILVTAVAEIEDGIYLFCLEHNSLFAQHWLQIRHMFQASPFNIVNNDILMPIFHNNTYRVFMEAVDLVNENDDVVGFFLLLNNISAFCGTA